MFNAIVIEKDDDGYHANLKEVDDSILPGGDVTVDVEYSSLNYKDCLAITGKAPVVRSFPMIPGIDLAGTVSQSTSAEFPVGQKVILNGWGVGEKHCGGLAKKARLSSKWLVPLPKAFTPRQAMAIGTAGYTAMLCVMALEKYGVHPDKGDIVVTGASGGVGSTAIVLLSKLEYDVIAVTGRAEEHGYLERLGACEIMDRSVLAEPGKPLGKERWAGAVDAVGSTTLANICAQTNYRGVVTACGLAGGMDFPSSVAPFILRGVTLVGIDSVMCPKEERIQAWNRLAQDLDLEKLSDLTEEISLSDVIPVAQKFMDGAVRGRVVVKH